MGTPHGVNAIASNDMPPPCLSTQHRQYVYDRRAHLRSNAPPPAKHTMLTPSCHEAGGRRMYGTVMQSTTDATHIIVVTDDVARMAGRLCGSRGSNANDIMRKFNLFNVAVDATGPNVVSVWLKGGTPGNLQLAKQHVVRRVNEMSDTPTAEWVSCIMANLPPPVPKWLHTREAKEVVAAMSSTSSSTASGVPTSSAASTTTMTDSPDMRAKIASVPSPVVSLPLAGAGVGGLTIATASDHDDTQSGTHFGAKSFTPEIANRAKIFTPSQYPIAMATYMSPPQ